MHMELIVRCKKGDIRAQYSLYKLFVKNLYRVAMRYMNNKMDADEIVQDTFITAFQKIDDYEGKGHFGQWLRRILINNCITILRKRKIYFEDIDEVNVSEELIDEVEEDIDPSIVHEAIKGLPERSRVVLNLYALEGYKHREIAEILKIDENTSKSQYSRARRWLQERLITLKEERIKRDE